MYLKSRQGAIIENIRKARLNASQSAAALTYGHQWHNIDCTRVTLNARAIEHRASRLVWHIFIRCLIGSHTMRLFVLPTCFYLQLIMLGKIMNRISDRMCQPHQLKSPCLNPRVKLSTIFSPPWHNLSKIPQPRVNFTDLTCAVQMAVYTFREEPIT